jgi:hypothetical protein
MDKRSSRLPAPKAAPAAKPTEFKVHTVATTKPTLKRKAAVSPVKSKPPAKTARPLATATARRAAVASYKTTVNKPSAAAPPAKKAKVLIDLILKSRDKRGIRKEDSQTSRKTSLVLIQRSKRVKRKSRIYLKI